MGDSDRRADWQRRALRFAWQLLKRSTRDMVTSPKRGATWAILAAELGTSRRTVASLFAWFIAHGLLHRLRPGTTVRFRPGTLAGLIDDGRGNEAALYQMIIPLQILDQGTLDNDLLPTDEVPWPCATVLPPAAAPARRSPTGHERDQPVDGSCTPNPSPPPVGENHPLPPRARRPYDAASLVALWPASVTPRTKTERLRACERLRQELPILARISARHLRSLLRQAMVLGATINDIRHALDVRPDDAAWTFTQPPRWVPGWLRQRLSAWIGPDGYLLAPWPSQQRAAALAAARAEHAALPWTARVPADAPLREAIRRAAARGAARARTLMRERHLSMTDRLTPPTSVVRM
ncbi:MAG TPA: hypothetical protein VFV66_17020 [Nonomuraea sp.]|nr:hypothetical protein [Nonomuraea sp.]